MSKTNNPNKKNVDFAFSKLTGRDANNTNNPPQAFTVQHGTVGFPAENVSTGFPVEQANIQNNTSEIVQNEAEKVVVTEPKKANNKFKDVNITIAKVEKAETRSKRFEGTCKPSVHKKATKKAAKLGMSLNEALNQFLEAFVEDEE